MKATTIGPCTLYESRCEDVLDSLSGHDLVLTDPPYGINITKSARISVSRGFGGRDWDGATPDKETLCRVLKLAPQAILWGGNYFDLPPARCFLIWDKINDNRDFADCEQAWTNLDQVARIFRMRPMNMDGGKVHPTQKPVELMKWCMDKATGTSVLDPYMGSGSTGVACIKLGRAFTGIECSAEYFDIACKRMEDAMKQPDLFVEKANHIQTSIFDFDVVK